MFTSRISRILIVLSVVVLGLLSLNFFTVHNPAADTAGVTSEKAGLAQRQDEWAAGVAAEQAYSDQRHGEWNAGLTVAADRSYDAIERLRVGALATSGESDLTNRLLWAAPSLNGHRGGFNPDLARKQQLMSVAGMNEPVADRSYDAIENLRAQRFSE